jgi:hypothetical protein
MCGGVAEQRCVQSKTIKEQLLQYNCLGAHVRCEDLCGKSLEDLVKLFSNIASNKQWYGTFLIHYLYWFATVTYTYAGHLTTAPVPS